MLDFIYYPVSFILWCWHWVFGHILGDSNAIGWALSIVFLVFTLRAILLKPAIAQVRSMRKMQEFQPEIKKIQKKYANDRQRQAMEMQKLQREHGVNPLGGCLPMVLQIPVFIGLNHVLRSFSPHSSQNYFFKAYDVQSYLNADLFGAHLGDMVFGTSLTGGASGWHWSVAPVAIPLMIAASVATHFTARLSVQRQIAMGTAPTQQTAMMNRLTLYIFPLGVLVFGFGFPIGLLLYWLSNNAWTLGQQHFVMQRMDREEEQKKAKAVEQRQALAPKPGQKPIQSKAKRPVPGSTKQAKPASEGAEGTGGTTPPADASKAAGVAKGAGSPAKGSPAKGAGGAAKKGAGTGGTQGKANGRPSPAAEVPGLETGRSQRKKQDRKRG